MNCFWLSRGDRIRTLPPPCNLDENKAIEFSKLLNSLGFDNKILYNNQLKDKLGTAFYKIAIYTSGGVLLNPGKLVRAMIDTLPENIKLYEKS